VAEHSAVLDPCPAAGRRGAEIAWLPTGADGLVDPAAVEAAITGRTVLVSVMYANNEIGGDPAGGRDRAHLPGARRALSLRRRCRPRGKVPVVVNRDPGGFAVALRAQDVRPKGVGALYVRRRDPRVELAAQMDGGGARARAAPREPSTFRESWLRRGLRHRRRGDGCRIRRLRALRDRLLEIPRKRVEQVHVNGSRERRLPHNSERSFAGVEAESLLMAFPTWPFPRVRRVPRPPWNPAT